MKRNLVIIIILCLSSASTWASPQTLFCSHPEICSMINQLSDAKTESLVSITGDPHEYEPSILEIKKLISAPILITGPTELNPWIKKVIFQRRKIATIQTVSILFDEKDYLLYSQVTGEALSHFWLYPKVYCSLKLKMADRLVSLGFALKPNKPCDSKTPEDKLRFVLQKIKSPIILTHDALLPLLLNLAPKQLIVAIKGSGHHEEANPASIKKMYNALDSKKVIWIEETGINIPQNIINKIRPSDFVVKIDTSKGKEGAEFSVLKELTEKLTSFQEK
jgi:hypothetical protein